MRSLVTLAALLVASQAFAQAFEALRPVHLDEMGTAELKPLLGAWEIHDKAGRKRCRIRLKRETEQGRSAIDFTAGCTERFPVLAKVAGWRLMENTTIDFVDGSGEIVIRFSSDDPRGAASDTPGLQAFATPGLDGIEAIAKK